MCIRDRLNIPWWWVPCKGQICSCSLLKMSEKFSCGTQKCEKNQTETSKIIKINFDWHWPYRDHATTRLFSTSSMLLFRYIPQCYVKLVGSSVLYHLCTLWNSYENSWDWSMFYLTFVDFKIIHTYILHSNYVSSNCIM